MKIRLETLTNVAIIGLCVTVSAVLIHKHFLPGSAPTFGIAKGQAIAWPNESASSETRPTLILALSPDCRYCTESMPFYRELMQRRDSTASPLRVVAVVKNHDEIEREQQILRSSDVSLDALTQVDFRSLGIPGTPVMILVDERGKALEVWNGRLTREDEDEVFRRLELG